VTNWEHQDELRSTRLDGIDVSDIEIHHLGAAYALDALDERERIAYEAHYATCELCRTDVGEYRQAAAELASLTAAAPPSELKSRVLSEISTTRQLSPLPTSVARLSERRPSRALTVVASIAAAIVLFLAGAAILGGRGDDSFGDEVAAMMEDPSFAVVELTGDGPGSFKVAWTDDRAAVIGGDLPDPGEDKRYELWMIDSAGAHAMSMLDSADDGEIRRVVAFEGTPGGWGVTIEPEAGSDTPTEPILYQAAV
jgi:anti-sigma-K factor RskA